MRELNNRESFSLNYDNQKNVSSNTEVTVITPTYNRKDNLKNMLLSLSQQNYPTEKFEVIIIDDGSRDDTEGMVKQLDLPYRLRYFWQDDLGSRRARARNIGIDHSEGEVILFLDSDVLCRHDLISEHMKIHRRSDNYLIEGYIYALAENETKSLSELRKKVFRPLPHRPSLTNLRLKYLERQGKTSLGLTICSMHASVYKKHLLAINRFDEDYDGMYGCEDMDLGYRLAKEGLKIYWAYRPIVYHQDHPISEPRPVYDGIHRNELLMFIKHPEMLTFTKLGIWDNKCYGKNIEEIKEIFSSHGF